MTDRGGENSSSLLVAVEAPVLMVGRVAGPYDCRVLGRRRSEIPPAER
jgi:hypothetical protein